MKQKSFCIIAIIALTALALTGCPPEPEPAHTHDYSTAWKSNAIQHWHECSCGDKTDVATHEWQWVETTPATTEADGLETETCTTCGEISGNTRPIAKIDLFEGTWVGTSDSITYKVVAKNGSFTQYNDDTLAYKGTYTVSENTVTMTWTHKYENNEWVTFSTVGTGTISGNTFTTITVIFTKQ